MTLLPRLGGAVVEWGRGAGGTRASNFSVEGTGCSKPPPPFRNLGNFVNPTLPVPIRRDSKRRWSLLSGVYGYARGSKRPHTASSCLYFRSTRMLLLVLAKKIKAMKDNKSPGVDGIPPKLLK